MKSYLKTLKLKKSPLLFIEIAVSFTFMVCLSSCAENQITLPESSSAILYVNQQLGFSVEFPLDWMGQVEIEEEYGLNHQNGGNCITFYHKPTRDNGESGVLFFIDCYPGEWSEENPPIIAGYSVVVAQTEDYTYLLRTSSGVECSESNAALAESYQSLAAQLDFIVAHIKSIF